MADSTNNGLAKDSNIIGAVAYLNLFIAVIIYLIKKEDRFVKFHAMQAILFDVVQMGIALLLSPLFFVAWFASIGEFFRTFFTATTDPSSFFPFSGSFLLLWLGSMAFTAVFFAIRLFMMYKAYKKERYRFPGIGNLAEKHSG